jgi:hypothetical protein
MSGFLEKSGRIIPLALVVACRDSAGRPIFRGEMLLLSMPIALAIRKNARVSHARSLTP